MQIITSELASDQDVIIRVRMWTKYNRGKNCGFKIVANKSRRRHFIEQCLFCALHLKGQRFLRGRKGGTTEECMEF